jgi:signal transduction histidine kinase
MTVTAGLEDPRAAVRRRIRVMVVDDSADHRTLIAHRLVGAGMQVIPAATAAEALDRVAEVDLVLLDYRLPGVSGLDALRAIRRRRQPPSVIMVTSAGSTEVAVDALRAGAIHYVIKDRGYLDALPEVVERAWVHHDLAARASELQRLALLVTSARDRDQLFLEIVEGAARLLRASSSGLLLEEDGRLDPVVAHGRDRRTLVPLASRLTGVEPEDDAWMVDGCLVVPLPAESGDQTGYLLVWPEDGESHAEEQQLAQVFASFAGIALHNLRRLELERLLVSELQQTLDARRDFIASVSHELRTPLTSIAGFTSTLSMHWAALDAEQREDLLARIGRNADDLRDLVDELLALASVERGRGAAPMLEELDVHEQVVRTLEHLEHLLEGRELVVRVPSVTVVGDASLLRRSLANLLTNAVKFSDVETPIEVVATPDVTRVTLAVTDHGIGLPAWEAARVFDPFFRARSSVANAVRGSGIGLALVREYIRTMGGEVAVASSPGRGSTFSFTLPRPVVVDLNVLDGRS